MQQIGLDAVLNNVPDFTGGIDKMNRAVDSFASNGKQAGADFGGGFGEIVTGALRHIGTLAVDALMQAGRAVTGFVKDSIGLAGDFQSGMLEFQSVAGKEIDTSGLEEFHDLFLQLGKDLPVSTSDVQQAAIEMVKGGIDPATIAAGGLRQNIQFAAAAMGGDLVTAAEISSKIMGGWAGVGATAAEKADFLTHATDMLAKAANASSTDVEGLSRGIFNAQGIARTAGVSFDDLTTTLAALAPRFASSSEAGNSLKNMIVRLQPTTDPAIAAMEQLGLYTEEAGSAFYDAQGNFIGFQQASELLKQSLVGLTKEQQAAALQTIFGNDAMGSAAALAELGAAGYQEMADSLANANGVMDAAALKQQGFNTSLDNAMGSVEALKITLGEKLLPVLGTLLDDYIAPFVNGLTDVAGAFFEAGGMSSEFGESVGALATTLGLPGEQIQDIVFAVQDVIGAFDEAGGMSSEFGESLGYLATQLGLPGEVIQDLTFAVQGMIAAAGDGSAAVDDLSGIWQKAITVVDNVMAGYQAIAQSVLPIVTRFVDEHGTEIAAFFQGAYDKIMRIINLALDVYNKVVPFVLRAVAQSIEDHADSIQTVLSGAWDAITGIINGALTLIEGTLKIALDLMNGDWEKAWTDLQAMSAQFVLDLQQTIGGFLDIIAGFFDTSMAEIVDIWTNNWNQLMDIATSFDWANVGAMVVGGIIGGINDNADRLMNTLKNLASDALQAAKDALGISSPSKAFAEVGMWSVQGIMMGIEDTWPTLTSLVGTLSGDLTDEMEDIGSQMQNAIADGFGATASIDRQIAKNLDKFKDIPDTYRQYTEGALKQAQDEAQAMADPAQGAKYFKMRSDQILEYAKLQKDLADTQNSEDRDRIQQQMLLINRAQQAELDQFNATVATTSPLQDMWTQVNDILKTLAGIHLTDDQIHIVDMLAGVLSQLSVPVNTRADAYAHPSTTNSSVTNLNMPIYTNMSPTAIQSSMAIAGAALL